MAPAAVPVSAAGASAPFDVIVVGGGAAGLIAALDATDAGADTLLLESEAHVGGSTALAAGHVALCDTELVPGGRDEFYEDLVAAHRGGGDRALTRLYVDECGATHARLQTLGVRFARSVALSHMRRPWAHEMPIGRTGGGAQIVAALLAAARSRQRLRIATSMRVTRLVQDGRRVSGVVVAGETAQHVLAARRAVVLASGGFTRNRDLIANFGRPGAQAIVPVTGAGSRGDGLLMAQAVGAGTAYMTAGITPTAPVDRTAHKAVLVMYCGAVIVNADGARFCRESDLYSEISTLGLAQPGALMIHLYDAAIRARFKETTWATVFEGAREYEGATLGALLAGLHEACGIDAPRALATLERYNASIGAPDPEFGRVHLVGTNEPRVRIAHAPYYATITVPGTTHFNGGLCVDSRMRVQDVYSEPIPGLYAAGEITGGFHGPGYMSASQIGAAIVFGRVAARNAVGTIAPLSLEEETQ